MWMNTNLHYSSTHKRHLALKSRTDYDLHAIFLAEPGPLRTLADSTGKSIMQQFVFPCYSVCTRLFHIQ